MNPNYQGFKFPQIKPFPWGSIFRPSMSADIIDCIEKMLCFNPNRRIKAIESCAHTCFSDIHDGRACEPENAEFSPLSPELLQFTPQELSLASAEIRNLLVPKSVRSIADSGTVSAGTTLPSSTL